MGETLATTLTSLGSIFTSIMGYVSTIVNTITSTPLLFISFGFTFTYVVIRVARRLFSIA